MRIVLDAESEAAAYRNVGMGPEAEAPPVRLSPWGHRQRGRGTRKDVPAGNGTGRSQGQLLPQRGGHGVLPVLRAGGPTAAGRLRSAAVHRPCLRCALACQKGREAL